MICGFTGIDSRAKNWPFRMSVIVTDSVYRWLSEAWPDSRAPLNLRAQHQEDTSKIMICEDADDTDLQA